MIVVTKLDVPNHRRSGWIRVLGSSLDWNSLERTFPFRSRTGLVLYILRRRTVAAERLSFFVSLLRLTSRECFGLPETFTFFSFFFAIAVQIEREIQLGLLPLSAKPANDVRVRVLVMWRGTTRTFFWPQRWN